MTARAKAVAGVVLTLSLAGCAVGPRLVTPKTPPTASGPFQAAGRGDAFAPAPLPPGWWRLYQDPVLDSLVAEALTHNQDLKVAAANLAYAQALLEEAQAGRFPSTALTAGGPTYGKSSLQALAGKAATTGYSAGLTAAYQLDLFGRIQRGVQASRANAEAVQAAEDVVRVTVAAQTAGAYANVCAYGEQVDVARRSLSLVQESHDLTVAQRDAGALSDFDVARQATLLAQAKAAIAPLEGQRRAAQFTLAALIGRTPSQLPAEALTCRIPPSLSAPLPTGDGAALLRRRPDLRQAERQFRAATARIGVAAADLYPTITVGGAVNNAASSVPGLGRTAGATYSVGPLLSWSFPDILTARARVKAAGAQASGALAAFDGVVLRALSETERALATYDSERDRRQALGEARSGANEALRLADIQFRSGAASQLDLILAETTAVNAAQAVAQSDQAIIQDQIGVFQALGGGWEGAAPVQAPAIPKR